MKQRKITMKGCALALGITGVIAAAVFIDDRLNAQAYGVLTGVETKVIEKVNAQETYHILEIIPDGSEGEIGYLVENGEPTLLQDKMDEYLTAAQVDNTRETRLEYMNSLSGELSGLVSTDGSTPLSVIGAYQEVYFPTTEEQEGWNVLKFSPDNYETTTMVGHFERNIDGQGLYDENITDFYYSDEGGYYVEFDNTEPPAEGDPNYGNALYSTPYEYKAGGYYERVTTPQNNRRYSYISSYSYLGSEVTSSHYSALIDTTLPYKYVGENGYFDFVQEEVVTPDAATPGMASTEASEQLTYPIQIGQVWYTGGYANNEWFKNKIFAADILDRAKDMNIDVTTVTESQLKDINIENMDFIYICGDTTGAGLQYTLSGENWDKVQELYQKIESLTTACIVDSQVLAHIAEAAALTDTADAQNFAYTDMDKLLIMLLNLNVTAQESQLDSYASADWGALLGAFSAEQFAGIETNYVKSNIYFMDTMYGTDTRTSCFDRWSESLDTVYGEHTSSMGFAEVSAAIEEENAVRSGDELIDVNITKITVIQYIINYQNKRELIKKDSITILDLEPAWGTEYTTSTPDADKVLTAERVRDTWGVEADTVNIVHMTMAEYIGKINDINVDYDVVYIGLGYVDDYVANYSGGTTVYNDSAMNGLVYAHTGDYVIEAPYIGGLLDTDYFNNNPSNMLYGQKYSDSKDAYGYRTNVSGTDPLTHLTQTIKTISNFKTSWLQINPEDVNVGNVGVYRYGGNDITRDKLEDLAAYVAAKYPVVLDSECLDENGAVNKARIDNSSYLYEFIDTVKNESNVFTEGSLTSKAAAFETYLNIPKLAIQFYSKNDYSAVVAEEAYQVSQGTLMTESNNYGNQIVEVDRSEKDTNASYTLRMAFSVSSAADVSAETQYKMHYYMDLNADGRYIVSDSYTEEMTDILVYNSVTRAEVSRDSAGTYILSSGQTYVLEKVIPSSYCGVLPWKLQISQSSNENVHTAQTAYTIVSHDSSEGYQQVNVLQILSDSGNTFNMSTDNAFSNSMLNEIKNSVGLEFNIVTVTASQFSNYFKGNNVSDRTARARLQVLDNLLNGNASDGAYDMLVFGFGDCYRSIDGVNATNAIQKFADMGRSVLFTHDTTSFMNVNDGGWKSVIANGTTTPLEDGNGRVTLWGYYFNSKLRELAGLDRYGVTNSDFLRQGQILNAAGDGTWNINTSEGGVATKNITNSALPSGKDAAYVAGSARTQTYGETQGYTYGQLNNTTRLDDYTTYDGVYDRRQAQTTKASQVNDGQITHFPYEIGDNLDVATTHFQYYQLDLEKDNDGDGDGDVVVWYCLADDNGESSNNYERSPNDVRNNYYIYSIGNITYSGVGHNSLGSSQTNEKKLFANTLVAAYKATPQKPSVSIIANQERTSAKKSYTYINMEMTTNDAGSSDGLALDDSLTFYYSVTDPNLATSKKTITVKYYLERENEDVSDTANLIALTADEVQAYITTEDVNTNYTLGVDGQTLTGLESGHVYCATLHNITTDTGRLSQLLNEGTFKIRVEIESSFSYYGTEASSKQSLDDLTVMKTSFINLQ